MARVFEVEVTTPFAVGNLVADVDLEDRTAAQIVLHHSPFFGELDVQLAHARHTEAPLAGNDGEGARP